METNSAGVKAGDSRLQVAHGFRESYGMVDPSLWLDKSRAFIHEPIGPLQRSPGDAVAHVDSVSTPGLVRQHGAGYEMEHAACSYVHRMGGWPRRCATSLATPWDMAMWRRIAWSDVRTTRSRSSSLMSNAPRE